MVLNSAGALTLVKLNSGARSKTGPLNLETRSKGASSQYHGELSSPARLPMPPVNEPRRGEDCIGPRLAGRPATLRPFVDTVTLSLHPPVGQADGKGVAKDRRVSRGYPSRTTPHMARGMVTRKSSSCAFQLGQPGYFTAKAPPAFDPMENPRHGWSSRYSRGCSGDAAAKAPRVVSRGPNPAQEGISDDNGPHRNSSPPPSSSRVSDKGPGLEYDARSYNLPHRPAIGHRREDSPEPSRSLTPT